MTEADSHSWSSKCQNCGASLAGAFCSQCGQRAIPPRPSFRELVGDAWAELVGWDGKLARTLRLLLSRPGELTVAALEGRRARYISPVRVYLVCSLLYFVVSAGAPVQSEATFDVGVGVSIGQEEASTADAILAKATTDGLAALTEEERAVVEAEIARSSAVVRPIMRAVVADFPGLQRRVLDLLPKALFVLIPVLAAMIGLFYRGRHYPEHLYSALHLQSVVFLLLTVAVLASYTRSLPFFGSVSAVSTLAIVAYAIVAQRRVYGGTWLVTTLKGVSIAVLYAALWSVTSFVVALWVATG